MHTAGQIISDYLYCDQCLFVVILLPVTVIICISRIVFSRCLLCFRRFCSSFCVYFQPLWLFLTLFSHQTVSLQPYYVSLRFRRVSLLVFCASAAIASLFVVVSRLCGPFASLCSHIFISSAFLKCIFASIWNNFISPCDQMTLL